MTAEIIFSKKPEGISLFLVIICQLGLGPTLSIQDILWVFPMMSFHLTLLQTTSNSMNPRTYAHMTPNSALNLIVHAAWSQIFERYRV